MKEIVKEITYIFMASPAARHAFKVLKHNLKVKVKKEIDADGGYIVTVGKKKIIQFHINRYGTIRELEFAESRGFLW
jgi:hypothetical protein